jgi:uncharacterized protein YndB with AHSA1/START domain
MQPRQNRKKKVKGRIYQKMKKAADDEGEVGDVMEDIAEDKVVRIAQDQNLELRRMGDKWVGADGEEVEVEVEEEEEIDLEYDSDDAQSQYTATSGVDDYEAYVREEQNITEEEEAAFNMFLSETGGKKLKTIADLIEEQMQKQAARARGGDMEMEEGEEAEFQDLEPQIVEVYKGVGKLLTRYKSGKLPKALKIVPSLRYASCTSLFCICTSVLGLFCLSNGSLLTLLCGPQQLAANPRDNGARKLEQPCLLRHHAHLRLVSIRRSGPALPQPGAAATGGAGPEAKPTPQLPLIPGAEKVAVQAGGLLQGHRPALGRLRQLQPARGDSVVVSDQKGVCARPPLCSLSPQAGYLRAVHRVAVDLHQDAARQKVRAALPRGGRRCGSLQALPARPARDAHQVAPGVAHLCSAIQERHFGPPEKHPQGGDACSQSLPDYSRN